MLQGSVRTKISTRPYMQVCTVYDHLFRASSLASAYYLLSLARIFAVGTEQRHFNFMAMRHHSRR